jgi:hypothetical protein
VTIVSSAPGTTTTRRLARLTARAVGGAAVFLLGATSLVGGPGSEVRAQTTAGAAIVVSGQVPTTGQPITSGGSASVFALQLPVGAACTGDSASSDYRIQSYMVPSAVDPATLTFGLQGPLPLGTGAAYRQPLFTPQGVRVVNVLTGIAVPAGGPGPIPTLPAFNFSAAPFAAGIVAPGTYNVGIACTRGGGTVLDRYWNVVMNFAADSSDSPSGLTWTVPQVDPPGSSTTSSSTTTTVAGGATTTIAGGATTTIAGGATTTVAGGATTTVAGGGGSATVSPASPAPGASYTVTFPNCQVGETVTFSQPQSTPTTTTATCAVPLASASATDSTTTTTSPATTVAGFRRPQQAGVGSATGSFTAAPTAPGTYTVTITGTRSGELTTTFTVAASTATTFPSSGGGDFTTSGSGGTIAATGASSTPVVVWAILLLVVGRIAILLARRPRTRSN